MSSVSSTQEKESRFTALLRVAGKARAQFDQGLMNAAGQKVLDRSALSEYLLIGMSYLASAQNKSLLWCLSKPDTAYGSEILARGLLEFLAQVAFVLGKETDHPVGGAEQRAICVSLARCREEYRMLVEAEDSSVIERGRSARALERVCLYLDLHQQRGCPLEAISQWPCVADDGRPCRHRSQWPCRHKLEPRPRSTVRHTLERLASRLGRPWLLNLYVTSSLLSHQQLIDRILNPAGGIDQPGPATYRYRATILNAALAAYGQALGWILELYATADPQSIEYWLETFYQLPDFKAATTGEWD